MRIAYVHNIEIELDSRSQKEVSSLIKAGHQIMVCGWNKDRNGAIEKKIIETRGCKFYVQNICIKVKKGKGFKENIISLLKYEFSLAKWLIKNRNDFEAVHACSLDVMSVAEPIAKIFNKKIVYDVYDDYADSHSVGDRLHSLIKRIDAHFLKKADTVIICSEKRVEQLATKKEKKLVVIHNTPDVSSVNSALMPTLDNGKLKIAYIGNLNDGRLVFEIAKMIAENQKFEFYCGGSGVHEQDMMSLSQKCDNIHFYGRLTYEQTLSLESNCDVIPAIYDPNVKNHKFAAPNKFYEALYLGKPTIMIHNTGMDDMVDKYSTGLTTEFSIENIERSFDQIADNLLLWKNREETIKSVYKELFSWDIMESRLLSVYEELER